VDAGQVRELMHADPPFPVATGTGAAALGRVSVTLSEAGLRSLVIEPEWLARQDDHALADSLATALAAARVELAGTRARRDRG
jgi:DNA-binding protein YbaB